MALSCTRCGCALTEGRSCPACTSAERPRVSRLFDPCVGKVIGDRYEVGELIGVGGMGRIHRGLQRSLDRPVAIKFIHPHLLTSPITVSRFMMEARAASRLSHPNVVSVFDFGRTTPEEGGELYLVMELLSGSSLAKALERESPLPLYRIADILRQTLLALSEAHRHGITHRDVKPDNIFIERHHGDIDHVKVIDFGIASMSDDNAAQSSQIIGTPAYMAPEQVLGDETGPYTDVYAVGVILFEMLVGRLPFDGSAPTVCLSHTTAPRPNPRALAQHHDVPEDIAHICMRAMAIKPAHRYPDAEAFAEAIGRTIARRHVSYGPPSSGKARRSGAAASSSLVSNAGNTYAMADTVPSLLPPPPVFPEARTLSMRPLAAPALASLSLAGRDDVIAWCNARIAEPRDLAGVVLWGRPGVGKTRLIRELTVTASSTGAVIYTLFPSPPPLSEVGYSGLRRLIMELSGIGSGERLLAVGRLGSGWLTEGLHAIFGSPTAPTIAETRSLLPEVAQTLTWAVHRAIERNSGSRVLLFIDDLDMLDGGSLHAVSELCRGEPIPGFFMVMTSERCPAPSHDGRLEQRYLPGLSREEAAVALGHQLGPYDRFPRADDIEPLYLEHWSAFRTESTREPPDTLTALIAARIAHLPPEQVRALQSLAITGGGALGAIALTMSSPEELEAALEPLSRSGFAWIDGNAAALSHALIGPIVLKATPESVVSDMHDRAANALQSARDIVELRAYHAVRGRAGLDAFLLLEDAAQLRSMRGDVEGAVAVLSDAVRAARLEVARGGGDLAASAYVVFGRKLATALTAARRLDEAYGVLGEMHDATRPNDVARALVCEQLAVLAQHRGDEEEAQRRWGEALAIAEQRTDYSLVQRFRRPIPPLVALFAVGEHRETIVPLRSTAF